jgi:hypothetical protein
MRSALRSTLATITAASAVVLPLALAPAASADAQVSLGRLLRATVGVQQQLTATVQAVGGGVGGDVGTVQFSVNGANVGSDSVGGPDGSTASVTWTPTTATQGANVTATFSGGGSDTSSVNVDQVGTQASITVPGSAATSAQVSLGATVRAKVGSYVPTGSVTFYTSNGTALGNANLDGNGKANFAYTTPPSPGNVTLYVIYNGDANAQASSRSGSDSIKVTQGQPSVTLVVAQTNYVGSPTQLTAKITPPSGTGTVVFSANGTNLGTANVANGVATVSWSPPSTGKFTIKATYSGGGGVPGGTATNVVTVTQALKADPITVNPGGAAGAWPPGSTQGLPNGTSIQLSASSASGQPVTLSVTSPCTLTGTTVGILGVGAPCTLTATTPGGNGFAPGNQTWTIVQGVGTQTAPVSPAASGTYRKGTSLLLASVGARTNLDRPITWTVTSGRASCKVVRAQGRWMVKLTKRGSCTVQGSAPAIPGQWGAFSVGALYRVR